MLDRDCNHDIFSLEFSNFFLSERRKNLGIKRDKVVSVKNSAVNSFLFHTAEILQLQYCDVVLLLKSSNL